MNGIDKRLVDALMRYKASGIEDQVDYEKFYLYSIVTHSTAIEGSTVTEVENQLLFDEGIAAKGRSLTEQMMNVDLKDAYIYAFRIASENLTYTPKLLQQLSALTMRRTGSEYSTIAGNFDSSKGEFRLCNVSAVIGGRNYLAYNKVIHAVDDFCKWLNEAIFNVDKSDMAACYRLSFEAHFRLVTIHPWVDGNGRTTRLLMNIVQRQLGLVPSIVTKENKGEYIQALIDSRENEDSTIIQDVMLIQHAENIEKRILQYHSSNADVSVNTVNDTVNTTDDTVNGADDNESRLLAIIKEHPEYTYEQFAQALNVGRATIARLIKRLNGSEIRRVGSDKTGHWEVMIR